MLYKLNHHSQHASQTRSLFPSCPTKLYIRIPVMLKHLGLMIALWRNWDIIQHTLVTENDKSYCYHNRLFLFVVLLLVFILWFNMKFWIVLLWLYKASFFIFFFYLEGLTAGNTSYSKILITSVKFNSAQEFHLKI